MALRYAVDCPACHGGRESQTALYTARTVYCPECRGTRRRPLPCVPFEPCLRHGMPLDPRGVFAVSGIPCVECYIESRPHIGLRLDMLEREGCPAVELDEVDLAVQIHEYGAFVDRGFVARPVYYEASRTCWGYARVWMEVEPAR